jgi:uncharacterized protein (TIGR03503 family)
MRLTNYFIPFITVILFLFSCQLFAADTKVENDIRILIDGSGSMKKNDPNNLRAPALRLIVGLMPDNVKAGAWTFGEHVKVVVPLQKVNKRWKEKAQQQSNKIDSRSLFTDIEQALNKVTTHSQEGDTSYQRNLIVLSDGFVDISPDKQASEHSRQRILNDIIPQLKQANIAVHTIALSDNADHELLRAMALATDGWFEQADNADTLQRVFLHLFEKAAQPDTVPLNDNHFKIDQSVSEMTLLVFRQPGSKPTELVLPDQSRVIMSDLPSNITWHDEANYDLITIESPIEGTWQIDAEVDPDNRVMVVTDLKLKTTDLPNNILIGESFDFEASLTEKDQIIERQDFLKLVDANLKEESEIADPIERSLNDLQEKGLYRTHVGDDFKPGRNDVVVTMKTATFERQRRQSINVVAIPFEINVERLSEQTARTHRIVLIPDESLINPETITITAVLTAQKEGNEWSYDVMKNTQQQWQLTLSDLKEDENYTVALQVKGETVKGRQVFLLPDHIALQEQRPIDSDPIQSAVSEENVAVEAQSDESDKSQDINEKVDEPIVETPIIDEMTDDTDVLLLTDDVNLEIEDTVETQLQDQPSSWLKLAIGNGIILLILLLVILLWRRHKASKTNPGDLL